MTESERTPEPADESRFAENWESIRSLQVEDDDGNWVPFLEWTAWTRLFSGRFYTSSRARR